jgi:2,3-bisphosphoglycerate-independent phosphoglycerate mutase
MPNPYGARYDAFTFYYALEYMKRECPRVVFISFDETDQHGHAGRYDEYLKSANRTDKMIEKLWNWIQSEEEYGKTTLLITTDHGRGYGFRNSWKNHGRLSFGSGQLWFAVLGPDTPSQGEMKTEVQYYQKQLAKTAASFLGLDYCQVEPVGECINTTLSSQEIASTKPGR